MKKKTYLLDTNVFLHDSLALFAFEEHDLVIPMIVLEELDKHKDRQDEVGRNAREFSRKLTALTKVNKNFKTGIPLGEFRGSLRILSISDFAQKNILPEELNQKAGDNQILAVCLGYMSFISENLLEEDIVLVSRDVLLRLKGEALGIKCEDYRNDHVVKSVDGIYTGVATIEGEFNLDTFFKTDGFYLPSNIEETLFPNQFLIVKDINTNSSALMRFMEPGKPAKKPLEFSPAKIKPKNKEQEFAIDLLMDPSVSLVSLSGPSGTGKSLLGIAAGLHQVLDVKRYKSLVVCRPVEPVGKDIGYLPGSLEEKMSPWLEPVKDNLRYLLTSDGKKSKNSEQTLELLFENGTIEIQPMTYIRGRTIANAYILIEEVQNISLHEIKTILTRAGEGSKVVLNGDVTQIDTAKLDAISNGLTIVIEKFKGQKIAGHVQMVSGVRSQLATISSEIL